MRVGGGGGHVEDQDQGYVGSHGRSACRGHGGDPLGGPNTPLVLTYVIEGMGKHVQCRGREGATVHCEMGTPLRNDAPAF